MPFVSAKLPSARLIGLHTLKLSPGYPVIGESYDSEHSQVRSRRAGPYLTSGAADTASHRPSYRGGTRMRYPLPAEASANSLTLYRTCLHIRTGSVMPITRISCSRLDLLIGIGSATGCRFFTKKGACPGCSRHVNPAAGSHTSSPNTRPHPPAGHLGRSPWSPGFRAGGEQPRSLAGRVCDSRLPC